MYVCNDEIKRAFVFSNLTRKVCRLHLFITNRPGGPTQEGNVAFVVEEKAQDLFFIKNFHFNVLEWKI